MICGVKYIDMKRYYKINNKLAGYEEALKELGLTLLEERRKGILVDVASDALNNGKLGDLFKLNENIKNTRNHEEISGPKF